MTIKISELIGSPNGVYSLPSIHARLNEKLKDVNASNAEIADLIEKDPGLSLVVLKIVNSAVYGFRHTISSITQAVALLGRNELSVLLLSTGIVNLCRKLPFPKAQLDAHWRHSLFCALIAKNLSQHYAMTADSPTLFVAGLLHDIGKPVIWHKLPELSKLIYVENHANNLLEQEISLLGFSHAEVGYELMKLWGLPESLQATTRWHHAPENAENHSEWCKLIALANQLAHRETEDLPNSVFDQPWNLRDFEFTAEDIHDSLTQAQIQLADVVSLFLV